MSEVVIAGTDKSLEDILNGLVGSIRLRLIEEFKKPLVRPRQIMDGTAEIKDLDTAELLRKRYIKDDLAPRIVRRLERDGVDFRSVDNFPEILYKSGIHKEPMKRAYWGQLNAEPPAEVMQKLPPWVAFYFYAGVWGKKSSRLYHKKFFPRVLANQNIYKMVYDCVMEGLETIKNVHNRLYDERKYKEGMKSPPHKLEVMDIMLEPICPNYAQPRLPFSIPIPKF